MSSEPRIAYLGDSPLPGAASYLAGIMTHYGLRFIHIPPAEPPPEAVFADSIGLYVLSDYASAKIPPDTMKRLCERVRAGTGLLMLGGWDSYHGLGGDYDRTPLAELLPVVMLNSDDRRNCPQLVLVRKRMGHPIVDGLPFETPPGIGGYNEFRPRPTASVVLEGERYKISVKSSCTAKCDSSTVPSLTPEGRFPLLVVEQQERGARGAGRRACLATDVAPHWVGGFVDWGDSRVTTHMGDDFIEVGEWYAEFFRNLLTWCLG